MRAETEKRVLEEIGQDDNQRQLPTIKRACLSGGDQVRAAAGGGGPGAGGGGGGGGGAARAAEAMRMPGPRARRRLRQVEVEEICNAGESVWVVKTTSCGKSAHCSGSNCFFQVYCQKLSHFSQNREEMPCKAVNRRNIPYIAEQDRYLPLRQRKHAAPPRFHYTAPRFSGGFMVTATCEAGQ